MAIINSMGVGRARKSMGNVTYRTLRGRTIGSQKRGKVETRATNLTRAQAIFGMVSMFMQEHGSDIEVSFNKSRYGSARNYFFRTNKVALERALSSILAGVMASGAYPPISDIEAAITEYATNNPTEILRVKLRGFDNVYLSGAWSSDDNPVSGGAIDGLGVGEARTVETEGETALSAPIAISLNFHAGAKIVRGAGTVTLTGSGIPTGITAADIQYLTANGQAVTPTITVTGVTSKAGSLSYTAPAIPESSNALAIKAGDVYIRLSSAYVRGGGVDENPFG